MLSESELDDRLHRCDPINRAALGNESVGAALAGMQRSVESRAYREAPSRSAGRRGYRRRWVTLGAATAVVVVASLVGVESLTGGGGGDGGGGSRGVGLPFVVQSAAAAQLNKVAHAAARQVTPSAGQWEYLAVKVENTSTLSNNSGSVTAAYTDTQTWQYWIAPDGDTRNRDSNDSFSFLTPQDRATYLANQSVLASAIGDRFSGYDPMVPDLIEDKLFPSKGVPQPVWETSPPSNPQTLLSEMWSQYESAMPPLPAGATQQEADRVAKALAARRPGILWDDLSGLLLYSTSTQLRETAYEALADVPDTTVGATESDQLGRSGVAVAFTGNRGQTDTLIASPADGNLLEEDVALTAAANGLPAGTVTSREIFLHRAIVDSDTSLPGGGTQPFGTGSQTTTTPASENTTTPASQTTTAPASQTTTTPASQTTTTAPSPQS